MIIYNVTTNVEWTIHTEWLKWMKEDQIPCMLATKLFHQHQLVRLLEVDETEGPTYAVQYYAHSLEQCNQYLSDIAGRQGQKAADKWGNQIAEFSTLMEVVN